MLESDKIVKLGVSVLGIDPYTTYTIAINYRTLGSQ
jgi:hypothetical protein